MVKYFVLDPTSQIFYEQYQTIILSFRDDGGGIRIGMIDGSDLVAWCGGCV